MNAGQRGTELKGGSIPTDVASVLGLMTLFRTCVRDPPSHLFLMAQGPGGAEG